MVGAEHKGTADQVRTSRSDPPCRGHARVQGNAGAAAARRAGSSLRRHAQQVGRDISHVGALRALVAVCGSMRHRAQATFERVRPGTARIRPRLT